MHFWTSIPFKLIFLSPSNSTLISQKITKFQNEALHDLFLFLMKLTQKNLFLIKTKIYIRSLMSVFIDIEFSINSLLKVGRDKGFADSLRHIGKLSGPNCATEEKSTQREPAGADNPVAR